MQPLSTVTSRFRSSIEVNLRDVFVFVPARRRKKKNCKRQPSILSALYYESHFTKFRNQREVAAGFDRRSTQLVAILLIKEVLALVGPRGLEFELGDIGVQGAPGAQGQPTS